ALGLRFGPRLGLRLASAALVHHRLRLLLAHHGRRRRDRLGHLDDEVAQHRVAELERVLELRERLVVALDVHEHVVRLVHLLDRVGELAPAPVLEAVHGAVALRHHVAVALDHLRDLLALVRMDDEDDLVMPHACLTPFPRGWAHPRGARAVTRNSRPGPRRAVILLEKGPRKPPLAGPGGYSPPPMPSSSFTVWRMGPTFSTARRILSSGTSRVRAQYLSASGFEASISVMSGGMYPVPGLPWWGAVIPL